MLELDERPAALVENRRSVGEHLSVLEDRARFLPPGEKTLVCLYLRGELRNRQMAQLLNVNPSTLCRRVRRWLLRLNDPIVAALIERPTGLSDQQRQIAMGYFLLRKTRRELGREFNLTPFEIAQVISYVRGWCRGIKMTR
jgi:DNA-directed RNA polymerase specialized sigma subunit